MVARGSDFDIGIHADADCGFTVRDPSNRYRSLWAPSPRASTAAGRGLAEVAGRPDRRSPSRCLEIEVKVDAYEVVLLVDLVERRLNVGASDRPLHDHD